MINENEHNWNPSYPYLSKLINEKNLKVGVELGVAAARHSEYILLNTNVDKLWSIDRWEHVVGYDDDMNLPQDKHDELYEYAKEKLKKFNERSEILRLDTAEASSRFLDKSLDFVYVDADHSYEGCKRDLLAWIPKIKSGGYITGHDANIQTVAQAVFDALTHFNLKNPYILGDSCWACLI